MISSESSSSDDGIEMIPQIYIDIIDSVDELGWESIEWESGYTLLHWAAKHSMADLCLRLIVKGADPAQRDAKGFDAFEYAQEENSRAALKQLSAGAPQGVEPPVLMMPVSTRLRNSLVVKARPRHAKRRTRSHVSRVDTSRSEKK